MTALTRFLFRPAYPTPTALAIVRWWEVRRGAYNLAVGTTGVCALLAVALLEGMPPHGALFLPPLPAILVYAIVANLCYTLGPVADLAICHRWGGRYAAIGPTLFRYGLIFSLGLTLLPIPLALGHWGLRILRTIF